MKKLIYLIFLSFIGFTACNDDFLDILPETEIGKENFFNTETDLRIYIYSLYDFPTVSSIMDDWTDDPFGRMYTVDAYLPTDNCSNTNSQELKSMMLSGAINSTNIQGGWNWEKLRSINFFLENFSKADITQEKLNHYEGLARFFRAQFYIFMVKRYSIVPWYDQVIDINDDDLLYKTQDSREFVVDKIFEDLDFAATHVLNKIDGQALPSGELTEWAIKAFSARFALNEGTYRKYHPELGLQTTANAFLIKARDIAKDIMDNGSFAIYNTGNPMSDYGSLFNSTNLLGNPEIILGIYNQVDIRNSNFWSVIFGDASISPTKNLLQAYLMNDGSYYSAQAGYETKLFVEEFKNRDPRLYQSYAYPGWELIHSSTYSQGVGIYIQRLQKNSTGYHQIKGFMNTNDRNIFQSQDFPLFRYAEILLTYAEARAELEELTQADLDISINVLRQRAGMPYLLMNPPVDPVQQARYPNISSSTSQWAELLEIRRERRIELAFEGRRWDDLMRWYAGKLLEEEPKGLYFPGLGKYDLTGDDVEDIILIGATESIPSGEGREVNSLGVPLIYYRVGLQDTDVDVYIENGSSGNVEGSKENGTFIEPKYYYRPIPQKHIALNPNLKQVFGWE